LGADDQFIGEQMNTSSWKETAELLALVAVIGGLIAVVMELRQTQSALRAQAYQTRAIDVIGAMRINSANPELDLLIKKVYSNELDFEAAVPEERSQISSHFYIKRTDLDNEHYQFQNGFLDPDFYRTTTEREIKAFAPFWRELGINEPRQQFTEEVDRILADPSIKSALN
jgi:hypothetical protein